MLQLLRDPRLAAAMGAAGRQRAARHDVADVARDVMAALQAAAGMDIHGAQGCEVRRAGAVS
jgi:hypothetical protein